MWINETGILSGTNAVTIGINSKFEIELEQNNFAGINRVSKINDLPMVKIIFYELSNELVSFLKNTINQANGIQFWNQTGLHDGIYQPHYYQDEFKQQVILTLYQKYYLSHGSSWSGNLLNLGESNKFIFGKGNYKIGNFEFDASRSMIEKNINTEVDRFKFANGYKYFCKDSLKLKITLFEPTAVEINQINQVKNSMTDFTPHIDRPEINYQNLFVDYKQPETGNDIKSVEINISSVS